jgi:hypothetical protein
MIVEPLLVENIEESPQGSDIQGLSADLIEAARRRNLSANSLAAYERTWTRFLAWAAAAGFDPRSLPVKTKYSIRWLSSKSGSPYKANCSAWDRTLSLLQFADI